MVVGKRIRTLSFEFLCIRHNTENRNDRQLEQDVERDPEGKITSRRKRRDTQVNQKLDCKRRYICLLKFAYISATERVWILTVTSLTYIHGMSTRLSTKSM